MNQVGNIILVFSALFLLSGFNYHQEKKAALIGPNCWNAVLVADGILQHHRYVNDKEFAFYMKSPLCRALNNSENRITGDIGSISLKSKIPRGADGVEHAFVYFDENLIYSKKNPQPQNLFKLSPANDLWDSFSLTPESSCFLNKSHPDCKVRTTFYRCQNLEAYLNKQSDKINNSLLALKSFEKIELQIENFVMNKMIDTDSILQNMNHFDFTLNTTVTDQLIKQILILRIDSIIDQFRALKDDYPELQTILEPELTRLKQRLNNI